MLHQVHGFLNESVTHELPAGFSRGFSDSRIGKANGAIDCQRGFDLMLVEHRFQAPETNAHTIFKPGEVRDVRNDLSSAWWREHGARHRALDVPLLDIYDGPNHQSSGLRQTKWRPIDDRRV